MAHNVSNEYKQIIYSGDARNKLKLLFNNVELEEADRYCEKMTIKSRIVPNGAKIFSLNNFISKEVELILHDIDTSIIQGQVSISIGTLVGNAYEYVPIGIFNIENQPTNDKNKTTIKLRDNSVKFDFNYNAQPLIEENGGSATKLQILQDICTQAGVTCNITSFIGYLDEIGIYDNTVTARKYIADMAEQAGKIATINRSGELIFIDLNNLTTWEIPIEVVEKYESGTKFKVGKVVYEDGIVRYETEDSNDDTLFLDGSNDYINGEKVLEQASSIDNSYFLQDTGEAKLKYFQMEGKTTQETREGYNLYDFINNPYTTEGSITVEKLSNGYLLTNNSGTASRIMFTNVNAESSKSYVLSFELNNPNGLSVRVGWAGSNKYIDATTNGKKTSVLTGIITSVFSVYCPPNSTITVTNLMYYEGTDTTKEYEPYGVSPSPDYPSELVSVGYTNLMPNNKVPDYAGAYAWQGYGDNSYTQDGNSYSFAGRYRAIAFQFNNLTVGETYTVSWNAVANGNYTAGIGINVNLSNTEPNTSSSNYNITATEQRFTFSFTAGEHNRLAFNSGTNSAITNITISDIQVELGEQHSYISYGKYGIEVKTTGKNLLNKEWEQKSFNYITGTLATATDANVIRSGAYKIEPNTAYTFSCNESLGEIAVFYYQQDGSTVIRGSNSITTNKYWSFTTPENAYYVYIRIGYSTSPKTATTDYNQQLEKGDTATEYEPYKENTQLYQLDEPLRSIGDTKDLLYIKNGMLYVERNIRHLEFAISDMNNSDNYPGWKPIPQLLADYHSVNNRFETVTNYLTNIATANSSVNINTNSTGLLFLPKEDYGLTQTQWKSQYQDLVFKIDYVLATPYIEELGVIEAPNTYEETTYIDISSNIDTNTYLQYRKGKIQVEAILGETNQFDIDSLKTGKILGNPAIDSYDLIQIHDTYKNETYTTLATNDLVYTGVLINTFDTQIGEEAKEQNVFVNGEETFKKWARTKIDNVEGTLTLQAGEINEVNGKLNSTTLQINSQGALLDVLANKSNIDVEYDSEGNPLNGEVREVTTTTGFKFNAEGMTIEDSSSNFKSLHRNTGVTYYDGTTIVGQYTKDGSKQKDLDLFGVYTYGKNSINEIPMFVAQLYTDGNGEEGFGHFYNRGD